MNITLESVSKSFKNVTVLDDINCVFSSGNIYGVVGKNGSGKTMLLRTIAGLIIPTKGTVSFNGKALHKELSFPPNLGIIIEKPEFLGYLSGLENLRQIAMINNRITDAEIRDYMKLFSLDPDSKLPVRKYSLGMKQKIGIIQAIMEDPDIIVLDEPFNALDEQTVILLRDLLLQLKEKGKLIILTSHHKDDIESICNEVIFLEDGRIAA